MCKKRGKGFLVVLLFLCSNLVFSDPRIEYEDKKPHPFFSWQATSITDGWFAFNGGFARRFGYVGEMDLKCNFDFENVFKSKGYTGLLQLQNLYSNQPNLRVESIQGFDNIEDDRVRNMTYLYQLWLQRQTQKWSILGGFYDLNSEFTFMESAGTLILPTWGTGTDIAQSGPNAPSVYPLIGVALRVIYTPSKKSYFQGAIFDAAAANPLNRIFAYMPFSSGDGLLGIYEMAYLFLNKKSKEQQGKMAFGIWGYSKKEEEDFNPVTPGFDVIGHNTGMYWMIDYPIFINPRREENMVHAFARFGIANTHSNIFDKALQTGILINGFSKKRPDDVISFGISPAWISYHSRVVDPELPMAEYQAEITYQAAFGKWLVLQPDFVYLSFPKNNQTDFKNAYLAGLRVILNLDKIFVSQTSRRDA